MRLFCKWHEPKVLEAASQWQNSGRKELGLQLSKILSSDVVLLTVHGYDDPKSDIIS